MAAVALKLYEKAQELSRAGRLIVCTDEKTYLQASVPGIKFCA